MTPTANTRLAENINRLRTEIILSEPMKANLVLVGLLDMIDHDVAKLLAEGERDGCPGCRGDLAGIVDVICDDCAADLAKTMAEHASADAGREGAIGKVYLLIKRVDDGSPGYDFTTLGVYATRERAEAEKPADEPGMVERVYLIEEWDVVPALPPSSQPEAPKPDTTIVCLGCETASEHHRVDEDGLCVTCGCNVVVVHPSDAEKLVEYFAERDADETGLREALAAAHNSPYIRQRPDGVWTNVPEPEAPKPAKVERAKAKARDWDHDRRDYSDDVYVPCAALVDDWGWFAKTPRGDVIARGPETGPLGQTLADLCLCAHGYLAWGRIEWGSDKPRLWGAAVKAMFGEDFPRNVPPGDFLTPSTLDRVLAAVRASEVEGG